MQAILKSENKLLVNGADFSEKILIENLVKLGNDTSKEVKFESVLDINGEVTGCMITIEDKEVPNEENTNNSEEVVNESEEQA